MFEFFGNLADNTNRQTYQFGEVFANYIQVYILKKYT